LPPRMFFFEPIVLLELVVVVLVLVRHRRAVEHVLPTSPLDSLQRQSLTQRDKNGP
jgi:hypothetical protein